MIWDFFGCGFETYWMWIWDFLDVCRVPLFANQILTPMVHTKWLEPSRTCFIAIIKVAWDLSNFRDGHSATPTNLTGTIRTPTASDVLHGLPWQWLGSWGMEGGHIHLSREAHRSHWPPEIWNCLWCSRLRSLHLRDGEREREETREMYIIYVYVYRKSMKEQGRERDREVDR